MNKIYRVIWSKTKNCYVVVSEIAKRHAKGNVTGGSAVRGLLAGTVLLSLTAGMCSPVWASATIDTYGNTTYTLADGTVIIPTSTGNNNIVFNIKDNGKTWDAELHSLTVNSKLIINANGELLIDKLGDYHFDGKNTYVTGSAVGTGFNYQLSYGQNTKTGANFASAFGDGTEALGTDSMSWGRNTHALNNGSTAWGSGSTAGVTGVKSDNATAFGQDTTASGNESTAWGHTTTASGDQSTAWGGQKSKAVSQYATAFGSGTTAGTADGTSGIGATAWGKSTTASGDWSTSFGQGTTASQREALAFGLNTTASGIHSIAGGEGSTAESDDAVAFGMNSHAYGKHSLAVGKGATTKAGTDSTVALGYEVQANGDHSFATGFQSVADGTDSIAMGNTAKANGADAVAVGSSTSAVAEGVALGKGSVANTKSSEVGYHFNLPGTYSGATWVPTNNDVAVGNGATLTRRITGVAAGSNDTDAVNVAQLRVLEDQIEGNSSDYRLVGSDGNDGAGETNKYTVQNGKVTLKVKDMGTESGDVKDVVLDLSGLESSFNVTTSASDGEASGSSVQKIGNDDTVTLDAGKNIALTQDGAKISVATKDDVEFKTVKATTYYAGDTKLEEGGLTIKNGPVILYNNVDMNNQQIHNVAPGTADTDVVNLSQLKGYRTKVTAGTNVTSVNAVEPDEGQWSYKIDADGTTVSAAEGGAVTVTPGTKDSTTNITDYKVDLTEETKAKIDNAMSSFNVTTSASDGEASGSSVQKISDGDTVTLDAGKNIALTQDGAKISVATKDDVEFKTVKATTYYAGDTKLEEGGLTIKNGPVILYNNVDMNNQQIHNVAAGTADTDVVNLSQLKGYRTKVTAGTNVTSVNAVEPAEGQWNYKIDVDNLGYKVNGTAATPVPIKDGINFKNGKNTTAVLNEDGSIQFDVDGASLTGVHYYSVNADPEEQDNYNNEGATGINAMAAGIQAKAEGPLSVAVGYKAVTKSPESSAFGTSVTAGGVYSTAVGSHVTANGLQSTAVGYGNTVASNGSTAIGNNLTIDIGESGGSHIFGSDASIKGKAGGSTLIGNNSSINNSKGGGTYLIGNQTHMEDSDASFAIGTDQTFTSSEASYALGQLASVVNSDASFAIGGSAKLINSNASVAIGDHAVVDGSHTAIAIGAYSLVSDYGSSSGAFGHTAKVIGSQSAMAIGNQALVKNSSASLAVGQMAEVSDGSQSSAAVGQSAKVLKSSSSSNVFGTKSTIENSQDSVIYGNTLTIKGGASNVAIGSGGMTGGASISDSSSSVLITGAGSSITGNANFVAGNNSNIRKSSTSHIFGTYNNISSSSSSYIVGFSNTMENAGASFLFGSNSSITGGSSSSVAIGHNAHVINNASSSVAIGQATVDEADSAIAIGDYSKVSGSSGGSQAFGINAKVESSGGSTAVGTEAQVSGGGGNQAFGNKSLVMGPGGGNSAMGSGAKVYSNEEAHGGDTAVGSGAQVNSSGGSQAFGNNPYVYKSSGATGVGTYVNVRNSDNGLAVGAYSDVDNSWGSIAIGTSTKVSGESSTIGIGNNNTVSDSWAGHLLGTESKMTSSNVSDAIGTRINISNSSTSVLVGSYGNMSYSDSSTSVGPYSSVVGSESAHTSDSQAFGSHSSVSNANAATAGGAYVTLTESNSGLLMGSYSNLTKSERSVAIGTYTSVSGESDTIAIGNKDTVSDSWAGILIGTESYLKGSQSIAIGTRNRVVGTGSSVIGDPNTVYGNNNIINANNVHVGSEDNPVNELVIMGHHETDNSDVFGATSTSLGARAFSDMTNGVALGADSTTGTTLYKTPYIRINGTQYNFAGGDPVATVSVGSAGKERTITNVAAGRISETSTDAINGSQLYYAIRALNEKVVVEAGDSSVNVDSKVEPEDGASAGTTGSGTTSGGGNNTGTAGGNTTTGGNDAGTAGGNTTTGGNDAGTAGGNTATGGNDAGTAGGDTGDIEPTKTTTYIVTANTTTAEAGSDNLTVEDSPSEDGATHHYTIDLAKDIHVNNITVDNSIKVGDKTTIEGDKITVGDTTINNDGLTINNGPSITKNGIDAGGKKITNVAPGTDDTDAVNVSQLKESNQNIYNSINRLDDSTRKGIAGAAALAALHPLDFDPDDKWEFSAGVGHYRGETAAAVGAFYHPNDDTIFSLGATVGNGENLVNGGVTFRFGQNNHQSRSKKAMAKEIVELRAEVAELKALVYSMANGRMPGLDLTRTEEFPDTPENHWAYDYVSVLAGNGVLEGYPDGYFKGDRTLTRYEMAAIIYRAMMKGVDVDERMAEEFAPELARVKVDTLTSHNDGTPSIQRVRVIKGRE